MKKTIFIFFLIGMASVSFAQTKPETHTVQKGENLYRIALNHKVTVAKICEWNGIQMTESLNAGRVILLAPPKTVALKFEQRTISPQAEDKAAMPKRQDSPAATAKTNKQRGGRHIMQTNETVAMIANTYGFTEERFRAINGLATNQIIVAGSSLKSCDCSCSLNEMQNEGATEPQYAPTEAAAPMSQNTPESSSSAQPEPQAVAKTAPKISPPPSSNGEKTPQANPPKSEGLTFPLTAVEQLEKDAQEKGVKDAPTCSFMSPEEMAMIDELNLVRTLPKVYVQYVDDFIKDMQELHQPQAVEYATELKEILKTMTPCPALAVSECVFTAAKKHALEQKPKGDIDHQGKDGLMAWDRVPKECPMMTDGGECLVGGGKTVRRSVLLLLVDEGSAKRGHRSTILDPTWKFAACYKIGTVGKMKNYWIQNFGK